MAINKESVALNVINESLKLPFIKVDRSDFLTKTFSNKIDDMPKLFKGTTPCQVHSLNNINYDALNRRA
ncbi:hypothetical protein BG617_15955 [Lactiplantibacillus paraplantarum]|nr:hypothetical protein BG617_15955 [Lactiplantibacillus paraplantarum]